MSATSETIKSLNTKLFTAYQEDVPFMADVTNSVPLARTSLIDGIPVAYERYGRMFNRAPRLLGQLAVVSFSFTEIEQDRQYHFFANMSAKEYGFYTYHAGHQLIMDAGDYVGLPILHS